MSIDLGLDLFEHLGHRIGAALDDARGEHVAVGLEAVRQCGGDVGEAGDRLAQLVRVVGDDDLVAGTEQPDGERQRPDGVICRSERLTLGRGQRETELTGPSVGERDVEVGERAHRCPGPGFDG